MQTSETRRPDQFAPIADRIRSALVEHTLPSATVAVAQGADVLWEEGFGWADREALVPAGPNTPYSLASITKPITATALMVLVEQGKIDLDRPVNDYLGNAALRGWVGDAGEATVRSVANHTSGLPLHYHFFYEDEPERRPGMDETILRYGNLVTAPGERFHYSNLGYGVLDYVISRVSGMSYRDFLRQEVFLPLGMTRSSVDIAPGLERYGAQRYGSDGVAYPFYDFDHPGGSAVYASAHDLVRFGMFHLKHLRRDQRRILSDQSIDAMHVATAHDENRGGYGIGWAVLEEEGRRVIRHDGGMGGVATVLTLVPEHDLVVVLLTNSSKDNPDLPAQIAADLVGICAPGYGSWLGERRKRMREKMLALPEPFQPPPELLGRWRGSAHTYVADVPIALDFKQSGDVHAQIGNGLWTLVNTVSLQGRSLTGVMLGTIDTSDAARTPHRLHLDLTVRDGLLDGALIAVTHRGVEGGAPGKRVGNALSHPIRLTR